MAKERREAHRSPRTTRRANHQSRAGHAAYRMSASGHPDSSVVHTHRDVYCLKLTYILDTGINGNNQRSFGNFVKRAEPDPKASGLR